MGTTESKAKGIESSEEADSSSMDNRSSPSPQIRRLEADPRSPSVDITRTPIEVLKTPVQLPTSVATSNEVLDTMDDPRSPTSAFTRTPIVINSTIKQQPLTLHNKILDNARLPHLVPTPIKAKRSTKFSRVSEISSKLDEPTTDSVKYPENKRNSIVGLLETNIDFIETDLDAVILNKSLKQENEVIITSSTEVTTTVQDNELVNNTSESVLIISAESIVDERSSAPSINNTSSIVVEDDLPSIDELNRKLTNLIYQDKMQLQESPKKPNIKVQRKPLHEQNPNSPICNKSIPSLRVSDKPSKPLKGGVGSKIPVFRDKKLKGKMNEQCENTPPIMKTRPSQWAAEDSMII